MPAHYKIWEIAASGRPARAEAGSRQLRQRQKVKKKRKRMGWRQTGGKRRFEHQVTAPCQFKEQESKVRNTKFPSLSTLRDVQQGRQPLLVRDQCFYTAPCLEEAVSSLFIFFFSIFSLFFLSSIYSYLTPSLSFRSHFSVSVPASYQTWSINFAGHLIWLHSVTQPALKEAVERGGKKRLLKKKLFSSLADRETDRLTDSRLRFYRLAKDSILRHRKKTSRADCEHDQRLRWELSAS